eukprot:s840_g7.t3
MGKNKTAKQRREQAQRKQHRRREAEKEKAESSPTRKRDADQAALSLAMPKASAKAKAAPVPVVVPGPPPKGPVPGPPPAPGPPPPGLPPLPCPAEDRRLLPWQQQVAEVLIMNLKHSDPTVLIGSDLAYDVDTMPSLAAVLALLLSPKGTAQHAVLACMKRQEGTIEALKEAMTWHGLIWQELSIEEDHWKMAWQWAQQGCDVQSGAQLILLQVMAEVSESTAAKIFDILKE